MALRAVNRSDFPLLFRWRANMRELHAWSMNRLAPTVEDFAAEMNQVLRQSVLLVGIDRETQRPMGFVQAHNLNPRDGWCRVRVYFEPEYAGEGNAAEACLAFFDRLFETFQFRKIYMELFGPTEQFIGRTLADAFVEEGRLLEHTWHGDRYWDMRLLALYRERWLEVRERTKIILDVAADVSEP